MTRIFLFNSVEDRTVFMSLISDKSPNLESFIDSNHMCVEIDKKLTTAFSKSPKNMRKRVCYRISDYTIDRMHLMPTKEALSVLLFGV